MCLHNWVTKENASHGDIWVKGFSFMVFFFSKNKEKVKGSNLVREIALMCTKEAVKKAAYRESIVISLRLPFSCQGSKIRFFYKKKIF